MNTHIDPKTATSNRLASLLTDEFIFGDRYYHQSSKWAEELIKRKEEAIPHIGAYLMSQKEKMEAYLDGNKDEVQQGWILFIDKIILNVGLETIKMETYEERVEWAFNFKY